MEENEETKIEKGGLSITSMWYNTVFFIMLLISVGRNGRSPQRSGRINKITKKKSARKEDHSKALFTHIVKITIFLCNTYYLFHVF